MMKNKIIPLLIIAIQIISFFWYKTPYKGHSHIPGGAIKLIALGVINIIVILVFTFIFGKYGQDTLIWKIPFITFLMVLLLGFFSG